VWCYKKKLIDWLLCSVLCPLQHSIGYMGDGFYRSKDPTNSIKVLKEKAVKENNTKNTKNRNYTYACTHKIVDKYSVQQHSKSPSLQLYGVTRGQLPQRAGSLGLNGGGAVAAVPPKKAYNAVKFLICLGMPACSFCEEKILDKYHSWYQKLTTCAR